jgi:hypothetical protein
MTTQETSWFSRGTISDPGDPHSTDEAISLFANPDYCVKYLTFRRWPGGQVRCPACGGTNLTWLTRRRMWECRNKHPHAQFSVRSGTFMADSRVALGQWLMALWLLAERNLTISSYELARRIGVTQKSAWLMIRRIRRALAQAPARTQSESGPAAEGLFSAAASGIL